MKREGESQQPYSCLLFERSLEMMRRKEKIEKKGKGMGRKGVFICSRGLRMKELEQRGRGKEEGKSIGMDGRNMGKKAH